MSIRFIAVLLTGALGACGGDGAPLIDDERGDVGMERADVAPLLDGSPEDRTTATDAATLDASPGDADPGDAVAQGPDVLADAGAPGVDRPAAVDAGRPDVPAVDAAVADAAALDAPSAVDVPAVDVPADRGALDVATDRAAVDVPVDRPAVDVGADVPRDVPPPDAGCVGAGPSLTVSTPTPDQAIETCSESGQAVFFDFVAAVSSPVGVRSVSARWLTPDGLEAPPPTTLTAAPYRFRRQVGGPSAGAPALSVFGIRGTWRVEYSAIDGCGRRAVTTQPFSLIFTTRRCPNP
ncbi:MAG: hypothetical protein Q8S73_09805 [Deltaproteobacteria bacterium]|nr:hypothetical protein [Myxococcales bacterium]MDP3214387.1 hypothetical protein [Deltaproteobacteria bacterium]